MTIPLTCKQYKVLHLDFSLNLCYSDFNDCET